MTTATIQQIPLEKIVPSPFQARKTFDDDALKDLAHSMKTEGLIQPVTVRALANGTFELIAGERRDRAAKMLGWTAIDAIVQEGVSDQDAASRGLVENLQREDLNPLERAQGYKRLMDMGLTQYQIAEKVGLSDNNSVSRYIQLLDLPPEIQEILPRGRISEKHIRAIRQLTDKNEQIKVAKQADAEEWSVKDTEKRVNQLAGKGTEATDSHKPKADSLKLAAPPSVFNAGGQSFTFTKKGQHLTIVTGTDNMEMLDVFMQNLRCAFIDYQEAQSKVTA